MPISSSGSSTRPCRRPAALSAVRPWRTRISTPQSVPQGSLSSAARRTADPRCQNRRRAAGSDRSEARQTHARITAPTSSEADVPPAPRRPRAGGVVEAPSAERPPEQRRCPPRHRRTRGAAASRSAARASSWRAGRRPTVSTMTSASSTRLNAKRVQHGGPTGHAVEQRQDGADDQQPVVEARVAEHEPHGDDRRRHEPQEQREAPPVRGRAARPHCGQSANCPLPTALTSSSSLVDRSRWQPPHRVPVEAGDGDATEPLPQPLVALEHRRRGGRRARLGRRPASPAPR